MCIRDRLYKIGPPRDVPTGLSDATAGIFDEGADDEVSPYVGGLQLFHKFTVTVVNKYDGVGAYFLDSPHHLPDFLHSQRRPERIPTGTLDMGQLRPFHRLFDSGNVRFAGFQQIHLLIVNTVILEGAVPLPPDTDNFFQCVVDVYKRQGYPSTGCG